MSCTESVVLFGANPTCSVGAVFVASGPPPAVVLVGLGCEKENTRCCRWGGTGTFAENWSRCCCFIEGDKRVALRTWLES